MPRTPPPSPLNMPETSTMSEVIGLGTDILEIERIRKSIEEHGERFLKRLFTEQEINYCKKHQDPIPHYAGRFAGTEAVVKALGTGFGKEVSCQDIEILNDQKGKPVVYFSPKTQLELNCPTLLISISHEKHYVTATALWMKDDLA